MEPLPLVCLCLLTWSGAASADQSGSEVVRVEEGTDAVLPCLIDVDLEFKLFDWKKDGHQEVFLYDAGSHYNNNPAGQDEQFKGRVSHSQDALQRGDASIIIRNTKMADSGSYTCAFPRLQPPRVVHIKLVVGPILKDRSEENIPGASPKPSVTSLDESKDWSLLQCVVQGASPEPKVEWKNSSGNIVPAEEPQVTQRGRSYDVSLKATVTKTGRYRCVVTQEEIHHQTSAEIYVYIHGSEVVRVNEGTDAVLPCLIDVDLRSKLFDWKKDGHQEVFLYDAGSHYNNGRTGQDEQFKGRVSHFPDDLQRGNASIIIRNTKVANSGNYTCAFPRLQSPRVVHIELVVGASPKPSVRILDETNDWSLLLCEVQGASPEPKVEWKDSSGNIVPAEEPQVTQRGGSYDVSLKATVTKTDTFSCVVRQEEIHHQTSAETYVHISGASSKPHVTIIKTASEVLLQCEVHGASPEPKVEWKDSSGNIVPAEQPQVTPRGRSYDVSLKAAVTKTDTFSCVVTQEEIHHQTSAEIYGQYSEETSTKLIIGIIGAVVGFLLGGLVVAVVIHLLKARRPATSSSNREHEAEPLDK